MITIGRTIRWLNNYTDEVNFCKENGFDFMQIWFKDGQIVLSNIPEPKIIEFIKNIGFPIIFHAVFTPADFDLYGDTLLDMVEYLGDNEVIIHPVYDKYLVTEKTELELIEKAIKFSKKAKSRGITWYLENNSIIDKFHYKQDELKMLFNADSYAEQILDIAHIDNYEHLKEIIDVKYPKCLHVAGKHFKKEHEHLSLTQGDINYDLVFKKYLQDFDGRIILEVIDIDKEIIRSKEIIENVVKQIYA
ncbi:MAG: sugar phosphate isomerase/epimerase [Clostridia bacterium]|nr:sugar phosphate isomerase/epimerase [Clostridia bacterium]